MRLSRDAKWPVLAPTASGRLTVVMVTATVHHLPMTRRALGHHPGVATFVICYVIDWFLLGPRAPGNIPGMDNGPKKNAKNLQKNAKKKEETEWHEWPAEPSVDEDFPDVAPRRVCLIWCFLLETPPKVTGCSGIGGQKRRITDMRFLHSMVTSGPGTF